jgi:7-cyano-7-deazaguanine synthase
MNYLNTSQKQRKEKKMGNEEKFEHLVEIPNADVYCEGKPDSVDIENTALVLLSGGIDSATAAYATKAAGWKLMALSFDYKQRHNIELLSARRIAKKLEIEHHIVIGVGGSDQWGKSALTHTELDVPEHDLKDIGDGVPLTYVPGRNTIFLAYALGIAQSYELPLIIIGCNVVDYSGYPDCRPQYIEAFNKVVDTLQEPGEVKPIVRAPLIFDRKTEILRKGVALGVPYELTWSCYNPVWASDQMTFTICGKCDSCKLRKKAFEDANSTDPAIRKAFKFENVNV